MRHDEFDVRVAVRDLLGDHVQHKARVFQRSADRRGELVVVDERRADAVGRRMHEQDRAAPVQLGIDRLELRFGDRAGEARDVHVDPDAAKLVEAALHLIDAGEERRGARILVTLLHAMQQKGADAWKPAKPRKRNVTTALKAYAALTTSAARGAVREIPAALR